MDRFPFSKKDWSIFRGLFKVLSFFSTLSSHLIEDKLLFEQNASSGFEIKLSSLSRKALIIVVAEARRDRAGRKGMCV